MTQYELFKPTYQQLFDDWKNTKEGGHTCSLFIKIAYGLHKYQGFKRFGAKAIIERIRWHYDVKKKRSSEEWKINNNFTAYIARHAMEREPKLKGFFEVREVGKEKKPTRAVVIPLKERTA